MTFEDGKPKILPSNYSMPGNLYIFNGASKLNLYDMSTGEGDLMNVQYHEIDTFKKIDDAGFDGVIIDDFAQSKTYGNVGHESVGLFERGIKKLSSLSIPAKNYDWPEEGISKNETPEFEYSKLFKESRGYKIESVLVDREENSVQGGISHNLTQ